MPEFWQASAARQRMRACARGDISKHRHEVLIAVPGKTRRRRLTITNSTDDFMRLIAILQEYGLPVRIGFEATGNYHRVLMYHLGVAGFDLKLVSSVALARTREALHNSWDKNDPKDAQVILHMLQIGAVQIFQDPMVAGTNDIQELSKTHDAVSRSKTELWHRILTHYLPLYFPEADRFHRSSRTDWFLAFLEMFPSPHMISAMTKEEFTTVAWEVVGRKVEKSLLLSDIYETAKVSAGLPVSPDSDAIWLRWITRACSHRMLPSAATTSRSGYIRRLTGRLANDAGTL